jgi:hypothetical protein
MIETSQVDPFTQGDLFVAVGDPPSSSPFSGDKSPAAAISRTRADLGIERAAGKAERALGFDWVTLAAEFLSWFASDVARGEPFKIEDARLVAAGRGLGIPANGRAWGAAVRRAVAQGFIVRGQPAPAHSSNGALKWQWRAVVPCGTSGRG